MLGKKENNKSIFHHVFVKGVITTAFIFFIGFGVMGLFWLQARTSYTGDKGFFYWRAATWGDGLCLSILVGSLYAYKVSLGVINSKHKIVSYILGGIVGVIGVVVQATWIISDTTESNWTIENNHFEPSGWYHAVYFVFMFFAITTLLVQVFFARKRLDQSHELANNDSVHMILLTLIWFSGLGYLFMHNIDDVYTSENYMLKTISTICIFVVSAFLYCYFSINKSQINKRGIGKQKKYWNIALDARCIVIGSLSALGFGLSVYYGEYDYVTAAMCAALSIIFVHPNLEKPLLTMVNVFLVVLQTFLLTLATLGANNIIYMIGLALITVIAPVFIAPKGNKYKLIGALAIILMLMPNIVSTISSHLDGISLLINSIVSAIIAVICSLYIPRIFKDSVIFAENRPISQKSSMEVVRAIVMSYTMMFLVTIPAIGMVVRSIYIAFSGYIKPGIELDFGYFISTKNLGLLGILILSISALVFICFINKKRSKVAKLIAVILLFVSYLSIILNLLNLKIPHFININNFFGFSSGWIILWTSLFIAFGFYDNVIRIRGIDKKNSKLTWISSILIFGGCFVSYALAAYSIDGSNILAASVPRFLIGIFFVICCTIVLPTLCCAIISFPRNSDMDITDNSPVTGVMHIGFLMVFPIIIGVLSVLFIGSLVSASIVDAKNDNDVILVINFLIGCLTLISGFAVAIVFCLKNNVIHLEKRINENKNKLNKDSSLYELSCHLRRQNIVAILMLAPYLFIPFIIKLLFTYIVSDNNLKSTWNALVDDYIPSKYFRD